MKKIQFTEEQKQYMLENYKNHKKSAGQLANEFNCSIDTIHKRLTEWGCDTTRNAHHFPFEDLTGQIFNDLLVLHLNQERYNQDVLKTNKPHRYWTCLCSCGSIKDIESSHLKSGHTISCGHIKSKGEQKITSILQSNNITFTIEKYFKDLRGYGIIIKGMLLFLQYSIFLLSLNCLILNSSSVHQPPVCS